MKLADDYRWLLCARQQVRHKFVLAQKTSSSSLPAAKGLALPCPSIPSKRSERFFQRERNASSALSTVSLFEFSGFGLSINLVM